MNVSNLYVKPADLGYTFQNRPVHILCSVETLLAYGPKAFYNYEL